MKSHNGLRFVSAIVSTLILFAPICVSARRNGEPAGKPNDESKAVHLTIAVTGGTDKKPVDNASVYVKFIADRKILKDKKIEMNLKTNQSGLCHVPEMPRGKVLIQIIAPGWKTYGEYYDLQQTEQTIDIALARPPKWY
jgi:hypothetical protein